MTKASFFFICREWIALRPFIGCDDRRVFLASTNADGTTIPRTLYFSTTNSANMRERRVRAAYFRFVRWFNAFCMTHGYPELRTDWPVATAPPDLAPRLPATSATTYRIRPLVWTENRQDGVAVAHLSTVGILMCSWNNNTGTALCDILPPTARGQALGTKTAYGITSLSAAIHFAEEFYRAWLTSMLMPATPVVETPVLPRYRELDIPK